VKKLCPKKRRVRSRMGYIGQTLHVDALGIRRMGRSLCTEITGTGAVLLKERPCRILDRQLE